MPVSASGERLTRSSIATRNSSSQSIASTAAVASPACSAASVSKGSGGPGDCLGHSGAANTSNLQTRQAMRHG